MHGGEAAAFAMPFASMGSNAKINKSGQTLGRKGHDTRRRVLEATERLLGASRGLPPPLAMIARDAGISSPTFYLYFTDVPDAIFAAVEGLEARLAPVTALIEVQWDAGQSYDHALAFIEAFFAYWIDNAAVLRARNRLADEGNERFVQSRLDSVNALTAALAHKIRPALIGGEVVAGPDRLAGTLVTAIERTATALALDVYGAHVADWESSKRALAYQLKLLIDCESN